MSPRPASPNQGLRNSDFENRDLSQLTFPISKGGCSS
jgi:hypothetical protein